MITPIPGVDVWQPKSDPKQVLVLHKGALFSQHARGLFYSGNVTIGNIERYPWEEFSRLGSEIIKKSLAEFPSRTQTDQSPRSELDQMSTKQKRAFFSRHRIVGIGPENGRLRLDPARHEKVGVKGTSWEPSYVSLDASPEEFLRVLQECFARSD